MKICGIVVEYNPFHNGHIHHIKKARELTQCDVLVAVMSGNFVQRGEPALIDKWQRTRCAIENGVDCILELPYIYATQSASYFAKGALDCLKLAQIDSLVFGSETHNISDLQALADSFVFPEDIKDSMQDGDSFPKAYGLLVKEMQPNDILGVAYLKQLQNTSIQAHTLQRTNAYHDTDIKKTIASASAIRQAYANQEHYEHTTPMAASLRVSPCVSLKDFYPYLRTFLCASNPHVLATTFLFSEGIENHLIKQARKCSTLEEFIQKTTTRRYTTSRIQRCLLQCLNQITKNDVANLPPIDTLRVLGFNDTGRDYLKHLATLNINVASRFSQIQDSYREMEFKTTLTYTSFMDETDRQRLISNEVGAPLYIKGAIR